MRRLVAVLVAAVTRNDACSQSLRLMATAINRGRRAAHAIKKAVLSELATSPSRRWVWLPAIA